MTQSATTSLILAYGNPLRGDDGVGWHAAQWIEQALPGQATVMALHQLTPELAETLSQYERAIFIDAQVGTGEPGPVAACHLRALAPGEITAQALTHHVTPQDLLTAAQILYGHAPTAHLLTIDAYDFSYREGLSPPVAAARSRVVEMVGGILGGGRG
jgi:hydrogenase maturation protease